MHTDAILAFSSAALAGIIAIGAAWRAGRSVERWAFFFGMALLAVEGICNGLLARAANANEMFRWQSAGLPASCLLPGFWLLFSLTYARGNAREFLRRWAVVLGVIFLVPVCAVLLFSPSLLVSTSMGPGNELQQFRIGAAGSGLYLVQLAAAVLVLMNLERTFRAAVGTVRWRIKFMLLGVGLLWLAV